MAVTSKKGQEVLKGKNKLSTLPGFKENEYTQKDTHTDTHIPTHTPLIQPKDRKDRRVQLLMKESTVNNLDRYAKANNISRSEIIQILVEDFLSKNT